MEKAKGASSRRKLASWPESARKAARARGIDTKRRGDLGEVAFVHKAMSLGYGVSKPYGDFEGYDFVVEGGGKQWRVQVKTSAYKVRGLYKVGTTHSSCGRRQPYRSSELDFVVAYVMPEDTWYVIPVREVAGRGGILLRPRGYRPREGYPYRDPFERYREAWHLLGKPQGRAWFWPGDREDGECEQVEAVRRGVGCRSGVSAHRSATSRKAKQAGEKASGTRKAYLRR